MTRPHRVVLRFTLLIVVLAGCATAASGGNKASTSSPDVPLSVPFSTAADLPAGADDVILIRLAAFPEGPVLEATRADDPGLFELLPDPLPEPLEQPSDCTTGNVTSLELEDGGRVDYGPCLRPDAIDALREAATTAQSGGG